MASFFLSSHCDNSPCFLFSHVSIIIISSSLLLIIKISRTESFYPRLYVYVLSIKRALFSTAIFFDIFLFFLALVASQSQFGRKLLLGISVKPLFIAILLRIIL